MMKNVFNPYLRRSSRLEFLSMSKNGLIRKINFNNKVNFKIYDMTIWLTNN